MISFSCPSGLVDRLSWTPGPDGIVIQAWNNLAPQAVATIILTVDDLGKLMKLCDATRGHTTWNQRPGSAMDLPDPGRKGGAK